MLYSRSLLVIHLKYSSVYMSIPSSLTIPSSHSVMKHYHSCLFKNFIYLFGYAESEWQLAGSSIFVAARGIFSCGMQTLSYGTYDLIPWSGMEPGSPTLGAWSLSHWTPREVPHHTLFRYAQVQELTLISWATESLFNVSHSWLWGWKISWLKFFWLCSLFLLE